MYTRGGGVVNLFIEKEHIDKIWIVYVMVDVQNSMGANTVNTVLEGLQKKIQPILKADHLMSIMTNLAPERVCKS